MQSFRFCRAAPPARLKVRRQRPVLQHACRTAESQNGKAVRPGAASLAASIDPDGTNSIAGVSASDEVKVTAMKVDITTDINNDGVVDAADDAIKEVGMGEIVIVPPANRPIAAEDLQCVKLSIEPSSIQGVAWFTYDASKVSMWQDTAGSQRIASGSAGSPTWNIDSGSTTPASVYVQGIGVTFSNVPNFVTLHVKAGSTETTDRINFTVTDTVGHYAYMAGVRDYLIENKLKLFDQDVDVPGGNPDVDFHFVAVKSDKATIFPLDAKNLGLNRIQEVVNYPNLSAAKIIVNGTFFFNSRTQDPPALLGRAQGICLQNGMQLVNSLPIANAPLCDVKGWFGQRFDYSYAFGMPNCDPPIPSSPYQSSDLQSAVGGLVAFCPPNYGLSLNAIAARMTSDPETSWNLRPINLLGLDTDNNILFFATTVTGSNPAQPISLEQVVGRLVFSGADVVYGLDGGSSVAMAHTDRDGNNMAVKIYGGKHWLGAGTVWEAVSTYVVVYLEATP